MYSTHHSRSTAIVSSTLLELSVKYCSRTEIKLLVVNAYHSCTSVSSVDVIIKSVDSTYLWLRGVGHLAAVNLLFPFNISSSCFSVDIRMWVGGLNEEFKRITNNKIVSVIGHCCGPKMLLT